MTTQITVPALGESVSTATVAKWLKKVGDDIAVDDALVELETDKVTLEVYAQTAGKLSQIVAQEGSEIAAGGVLGTIAEGAAEAALLRPARTVAAPKPEPAPASLPPAPAGKSTAVAQLLAPAVRKLVDEHRLNPAAIPPTGKGGRLTKADVLAYVESHRPVRRPIPCAPEPVPVVAAPMMPSPALPRALERVPEAKAERPREERTRMTQLRRRIAERLKAAQDTAAMLTTFNEIDMGAVLAARDRYKEPFEKKYGARLGFLSFFVKAAIAALKEIPAVNAEIDGDDIVYKNHYDVGVAVGTPQGLVVPVVRDADRLSFAELEMKIGELAKKARDGKLTLDDLSGGTFTITNGGVYGSLMSTPILNPPQSGILGMHKIEDRPMARDGKVEIRPMMYVALTYDHRIVDGREAVTFLVRLKDCIEDPQRLLLDV
jgi:2-oxoglutarate dehydrogenase E2 component (dihydrolipoamide succinyltransferase)